MTMKKVISPRNQSMAFLSRLLLAPQSSLLTMEDLKSDARNISRKDFDELVALASSNHVIVRGMERLLAIMQDVKDDARAEWVQSALEMERARIVTATKYLEEIRTAFEDEQCEVMVIKSLDHWPDLGSDLDLYTNSKPATISKVMTGHFNATIAPRSWGDRLAGKWNYLVPGLPEAVEIHFGRLGQTGEQIAIASHLLERARRQFVGGLPFRVPSASDRLMISTLQRMYRHFYFRLCDIVDSAALVESGDIDFLDLRSVATRAGIWEGVATYLLIISDYLRKYRGTGLNLPKFVTATARFGGDDIHYAREFLRVPIMPQSASLYGLQLAGALRKREMVSGARLSLLPWLATAALVGQKITGSDKGVW